MTALDDALNSNTPLFDVVNITATWAELLPGYVDNAAAVSSYDALSDLGNQVGPGGWSVDQSLIDGLPDSVTATTSNDGFGAVSADLIGRPTNRADNWSFRTSGTGSGTAPSVTVPDPAGSFFNDYQIVAIAVNSLSDVTDAGADVYDRFGWSLLATSTDGAIKLWVFGRRWYTGAPNLTLTLPGSVAYTWVTTSIWASTAAYGTWIDVKPGTPVLFAQPGSSASHTTPEMNLSGRGWTLGIWATLAGNGPMAPAAGDTELGELVGGSLDVMISRSPTQHTVQARSMTATTNVASATLAAVGLPLYMADRPEMTASAYFSPYRADSPLYGWERDTADLLVRQRTVTDTGVVSTTVFNGQMGDIAVSASSQTAKLAGFSRTRVLMDRSRTPPPIHGRREGLTVDWFANWLMANGGQTVGPGVSNQTRLWVPFYGSVHSFSEMMTNWCTVDRFTAADPGVLGRHFYPESVPGPYVSGMFGEYLDTSVIEPRVIFDREQRLEKIPGIDMPDYNDYMSQRNGEGRLSVWIRCDPFLTGATLPTVVGGDTARQHLLTYQMSAQSDLVTNGINMGGVQLVIDPTTGTGGAQIKISMGTQDGYSAVALSGLTWPTDGEWHFLGFIWDFHNAQARVRFDATTWSVTSYTGVAGAAKFGNLGATEESIYDGGGYVQNAFLTHLPVADFQVETGPGYYALGFGKYWPKQDPNAVYRRTDQWMEALAESQPVAGWETLLELGKATASAVRCNEEDAIEFLPPVYFGETAQAVTSFVADTELNASALDVTHDPSKSRNLVTITFPETTVDAVRSPVLQFKSSLEIKPGVSYITFPLDRPCVEIHGANSPWVGTLYDLQALTASQISTPSLPVGQPFMTVNSKSDGSGTVPPTTYVKGRIVGAPDASSIMVRITNSRSISYYLANNGSDVPSVQLLGFGVKVADAYVTVRDDMSIRSRQERTLTHPSPWINRRSEAIVLAATIANLVSLPRGEVTLTVMGDPRRRPGQLVEVIDSEGTQAEGTWRILSIAHQGDGPRYTQVLQLVRVGSVMIWDSQPGWNLGVWGE